MFSKTETKKKKQELELNFNLKMSTQLEGCVETMCNISDYFEEVAMEKGMQQGMHRRRNYIQIVYVLHKYF